MQPFLPTNVYTFVTPVSSVPIYITYVVLNQFLWNGKFVRSQKGLQLGGSSDYQGPHFDI